MKRELLATAALLALACPAAAQIPEPAPPPVVAPADTPVATPPADEDAAEEAKWDVQNPPGPSRDIPIDVTRGRYGGYRLAPGFKLPPLMFTDDEAVAVVLGLATARSTPAAWQLPVSTFGIWLRM